MIDTHLFLVRHAMATALQSTREWHPPCASTRARPDYDGSVSKAPGWQRRRRHVVTKGRAVGPGGPASAARAQGAHRPPRARGRGRAAARDARLGPRRGSASWPTWDPPTPARPTPRSRSWRAPGPARTAARCGSWPRRSTRGCATGSARTSPACARARSGSTPRRRSWPAPRSCWCRATWWSSTRSTGWPTGNVARPGHGRC